VDGALLSIKRAHESMTPGRLSFGSIDIEGGNINRSPFAYLANPPAERKRYSSDVDKTMTLLRFDRLEDGKTTGILTFFPVHGTSLLGNNTLVAGDNKGVAAYLFERSARDNSRFASDFVAAFSQSNEGDTSPNVLGAYCEDGSGMECRFVRA
jgi:neutral ceramidase